MKIKVFYTWSQTKSGMQYDKNFGRHIAWDIPLLDDYPYEFVHNVSWNPGSSHFLGMINPTLIDTLKKWNPDIILVYGWNFWSHLRVMMYYKGKVQIWFRGDSTLIDEAYLHPIKRFLRRSILSFVFKYVDKVLYVGKKNREYFLRHGISEMKLCYLPHAVDNQRFSDHDEVLNAMADKWRIDNGIDDAAKILLFVGKIEKKKSPELLIEAFRIVNDPDLHLVLVGDGSLKEQLQDQYASVLRVHWMEFRNQSEMPLVYRIGDVVILPSGGPGETWGLCLNEAMACGRAIAASDACGGSYDLIEQGLNGWQFGSRSLDALVGCLHQIQQKTRVDLLAMGKHSLNLVKKFSYNQFPNIDHDIFNT